MYNWCAKTEDKYPRDEMCQFYLLRNKKKNETENVLFQQQRHGSRHQRESSMQLLIKAV